MITCEEKSKALTTIIRDLSSLGYFYRETITWAINSYSHQRRINFSPDEVSELHSEITQVFNNLSNKMRKE